MVKRQQGRVCTSRPDASMCRSSDTSALDIKDQHVARMHSRARITLHSGMCTAESASPHSSTSAFRRNTQQFNKHPWTRHACSIPRSAQAHVQFSGLSAKRGVFAAQRQLGLAEPALNICTLIMPGSPSAACGGMAVVAVPAVSAQRRGQRTASRGRASTQPSSTYSLFTAVAPRRVKEPAGLPRGCGRAARLPQRVLAPASSAAKTRHAIR
jgi:hypothetical protein